MLYNPGKPYGHYFLSIMGFTRNGRFFFVQLRILVFDCECSDILRQFPKEEFQSKVEQIGSRDRPQILPYFPPNLDVPIKYQYFFNIMLKKKQ